jgi:ribosomal protein L29
MKDLIQLSKLELAAKLINLKTQLLNLRLTHSVGRLDKPHQILNMRRSIARIKTILNTRG